MDAELQAVLAYIDTKIASFNARRNDSARPSDHRYDFGVSVHTLGILSGDLRAGLHHKAPEA